MSPVRSYSIDDVFLTVNQIALQREPQTNRPAKAARSSRDQRGRAFKHRQVWLDFPRAGALYHVIGRPVCQRLDGASGLLATRGHETAAVHDEQVGHVMRAMILIDYRFS